MKEYKTARENPEGSARGERDATHIHCSLKRADNSPMSVAEKAGKRKLAEICSVVGCSVKSNMKVGI